MALDAEMPQGGDHDQMAVEPADLGRELSALAFRFAEDIAGCVEMDALSVRFQRAIAPIGMTASASGMISGPRRVNDEVFHFVNWPSDWLELYQAEGYIDKDPAPRWAVVSGAPIAWTELLETLPANDPGQEVYRRVQAWGFTEGFVTPVRGFDGSLGLVSVGGGRGRLLPQERLFLQSISVAALHRAEAILNAAAGPPGVSLPDLEHLSWDRSSQAILAVDATGLIHHLNRAAERLLLDGGALRASAGRLTMSDPQATDDLMALLKSTGAAEGPDRAHALSCRAADGRPAGSITVSALPGREPSPARQLAVVRVTFPDAEIGVQEELIRRRFSLTPAEWRVAAALYQGQSPQGLAAMLGLSVNTVRVQMSRVFAKTGVHRQTELVAAIRGALSSPYG